MAIKAAVDTAKGVLTTLKGHLDSLGTIGDSNLVSNATKDQNGVSANEGELKKVYNALKGIVEIAKTGGEVKEPNSSSVILDSNSMGVN